QRVANSPLQFGGVVLEEANSPPRITAAKRKRVSAQPQEGGVVASSQKFREATEADAAGVVFRNAAIGKPPRPREKPMLRDIFLIARPPLLAVMQGGESVSFHMAANLDSSAPGGARSASPIGRSLNKCRVRAGLPARFRRAGPHPGSVA